MKLTKQQLGFIETFGYLGFPGLLKDKIGGIIEAFESVWKEQGGGHDGSTHDGKSRSCIVPFIDQHPFLSALLDDPRVNGIFSSLLGEDFVYMGSDGNFYVSDTAWHSDTDWSGKMRGNPPRIYFKMAFYLDPLTQATGALRVIPGSHRYGDVYAESLQSSVKQSPDDWGIEGWEVPAVALETQPGDIVIFNQNTKHSAWGGSDRRRMFTINCTARFAEADIQILKNEISGSARFWIENVYGEAMLQTAGPERMVHLEQALANQSHLAEEVRKAKERMAEPSRG